MASLTLFLVLARLAHQGSRLSAVHWARDPAVKAVLGLNRFDEDDLYEELEWVATEQEAIEQRLHRDQVKRTGQTPALVLYDVTSSYFEGEHNERGEYGYHRKGKKGKKQSVIGLLTASDGEPVSIEVFQGNTGDPSTFGAQITQLAARFQIKEVILVGDRGRIKAKAKPQLRGQGHDIKLESLAEFRKTNRMAASVSARACEQPGRPFGALLGLHRRPALAYLANRAQRRMEPVGVSRSSRR